MMIDEVEKEGSEIAYEYCDWDERYHYYDRKESEYEPIIDEISMSERDDLLPEIIDAHRDRLNKVSYMDGCEYTPLFLAISLDRPKTVRLLLEHEADPLIPAQHGVLPIHKAFTLPANLDIIRLLLDDKLVDKDTIKKMLNAPDHLGETALHHASHAWCTFDDRYELVKFMIDLGARPRQNVVSKFPSEVYKDNEITELLTQCEVMEFFKYYDGRGLPDSGYDETYIKQNKVEIESKFDNKKTSATSKFPCKDKNFKKFFKQYKAVEFLRYYEGCGLSDSGYDENNVKQDKVVIESEFDNNKTFANSKGHEGMGEYSQFPSDISVKKLRNF